MDLTRCVPAVNLTVGPVLPQVTFNCLFHSCLFVPPTTVWRYGVGICSSLSFILRVELAIPFNASVQLCLTVSMFKY